MQDIDQWVRPNIRALTPYSSARDEFQGDAAVFMDANENPFNHPYNRYPDPLQRQLKKKIASLKGVPEDFVFLGNGSDEAIDVLFRVFCEPGLDNVVSIHPTYGMYPVCADINNVAVRFASLTSEFELDVQSVLACVDAHTKMIFLCSPNNPTGNSLDRGSMLELIEVFPGIVVVDEAYIDFSRQTSLLPALSDYENLVVLQTFSKAWGLAGVRLGMAFASPSIIRYCNKVKYPYNVNILTQQLVEEALEDVSKKDNWVSLLLRERDQLIAFFHALPFVRRLFPTDANFILLQVAAPQVLYDYLVGQGIIVRNRSTVHLCAACLRITVGTPEENCLLMDALQGYQEEKAC